MKRLLGMLGVLAFSCGDVVGARYLWVTMPTNHIWATSGTLTFGFTTTGNHALVDAHSIPYNNTAGGIRTYIVDLQPGAWQPYYASDTDGANEGYCFVRAGGTEYFHPDSSTKAGTAPNERWVWYFDAAVPDVVSTNWCKTVALTNLSAVNVPAFVNWKVGTNYFTQEVGMGGLWPGEVYKFTACGDVAVPEFLGAHMGGQGVELPWITSEETVVTNGVGGIEGPYEASEEKPDAGVWSDNPTDFGNRDSITASDATDAVIKSDQRADSRAAAQIQAGAQSTAAVTEGLRKVEAALTNAPSSNSITVSGFAGIVPGVSVVGLSGKVPVLSVPAGATPSIVLPYSAIGYGLADVTFSFAQPSLTSWVGAVRAVLASLMVLGYLMMLFRLVGRAGGL